MWEVRLNPKNNYNGIWCILKAHCLKSVSYLCTTPWSAFPLWNESLLNKMQQSIEQVLLKTEHLQEALQTLSSTNSSLRFYCKKLLTKIGDFSTDFAKLGNTCTICFEETRDHCLNPCGHLMCESCSKRCLQDHKCFVCRGEPENSIKIY